MDLGFWASSGLAGSVGSGVTLLIQWVITRWGRPKIVLLPYKKPFPRLTPIKSKAGGSEKLGYFVNIGVRNRGHRTAHRCQPFGQRSVFQAGKSYCFQVTLYCEDGDWAERWYQVRCTGYFTPGSLKVEEVDHAPWAK